MYKKFIFESYTYDEKNNEIRLAYSLDDEIHFEEILHLPEFQKKDVPGATLDAAIFALHLIAGVSYYKTYCPAEIEVRSGKLSSSQAKFWNEAYTKGLGEFFYENKIDFKGLINFPYDNETMEERHPDPGFAEARALEGLPNRVLVPIGGGKDSIVTIEELKEKNIDFDIFSLGEHILFSKTANIAGKQHVIATRTLSEKLFELNKQGAYNGHVPITAYIHFLTLIIAMLGGYKYVAFSNEASAEEGNVEYMGEMINHQYSKSLEFENAFREYVKTNITSSIEVFSYLRDRNEMAIAKKFSELHQYHPIFSSCNRNFKLIDHDRSESFWCCECPKCAFVFTMLAAFMSKEKVVEIFGGNLYENDDMLALYQELLGAKDYKPFECVGTHDEVKAAMYLASKKGEYADDVIMKYFEKEILPDMKDPETLVKEVLKEKKEHNIPAGIINKETRKQGNE